jgi:hypothetical protein
VGTHQGQVADKVAAPLLPPVAGAEDCRRVHCDDHRHPDVRRLDDRAAQGVHAGTLAEDRLRGGRPEAHEQLRSDVCQLELQPVGAGLDL